MALSVSGVSNAAGQSAGTTFSAGTAAITPTLPSGAASGDRIFVIQCHSCASGSATTPADWNVVGSKDTIIADALGNVSAGGGRRYMSMYYRDYDGAWSMPSFALASATNNSHWIGAVAIRRTSASWSWDAPTISTAADDTGTADTAHSATTGSSFTTHTNGMLVIGTVNNDNVTASADGTVTQTSATFDTISERCDGGTTTGNDVSGKVHTGLVTAGASNVITFACTLSGSSQGGNLFVEQTETAIAAPSLSGQGVLSATAVCPISTLTDNFSTKDTAKWTWGTGAANTSSQLQLTCDTSYDGTLESNNANYNLIDDSIFVSLVQGAGTGNGGTEVFFALTTGDDYLTSQLGFYLNGGTLYFSSVLFTPFNEENTDRTNQAVPSGTTGCYVTLIGGGGAGGNGNPSQSSSSRGGSGGGGGGRVDRTFVPVASLGETYSVTRGSGGASAQAAGTASVFSSGDVSLSAGGGSGGLNGATSDRTGGAGGTCSVSGITADTHSGTQGGDGLFTDGEAANNDTTNDAGCGGGGGAGQSSTSWHSGGKGGDSNTITGGAGGTQSSKHGVKPSDANVTHGGAGGGGGAGYYNDVPGDGGDGGLYGGGGGGAGSSYFDYGTATFGAGAAGYTLLEWV